MAAADQLAQRIQQKLEQITARSGEIAQIGQENTNRTQQINARLTNIRGRVTALKTSLQGIIQAKEQAERTLSGMEGSLDQVAQSLRENIQAIDTTGIDQELEQLANELTDLERQITAGGLPNAPNDPPAAPPPDAGGDEPLPPGQDAFLGDGAARGGYKIPSGKKKRRFSVRKSHTRSTGRRSSGRGGKKTQKKAKKNKRK